MENWDLHVSFSDTSVQEEDPAIMANSVSPSVTVAESSNQMRTNVSTTVDEPSIPSVSETTTTFTGFN